MLFAIQALVEKIPATLMVIAGKSFAVCIFN